MPAPSLTPQEFVAKWQNVQVKEKSGYQEHFIDLCRLVGHPTPIEADPHATWFAFEAGVKQQKGSQGWADVWKKGFFGLEYKGKHANLDKAYQQLLQYREALENPPLLIVSDMDRLVIHTNFTNTPKWQITLTLDDLLTPKGYERLRALFTDPLAFKVPITTEQVTEQVAQEFAKLATLLRKWKHDPQQIAHFLIRLLFCLFAEDIGLLPANLFSRLVERTGKKGKLFAQELGNLFAAMANGGFFWGEDIPHFNGRLFDDQTVLELDSEAIDILLRVSKASWDAIEPAVLGTLFERSLDEQKRSQLGAHYTSKDDILLIVEPVVMVPLRRRWTTVLEQARELAAKRDQTSGKARDSREREMTALLQGFQHELASFRILDPACGSGNFLYVALKALLDLEKEVITAAGDLGLIRPFPLVTPEQLHGIELNEYAHELAQVTVWIGYIQWLRDNGFGRPAEPILKPLDTIQRMDAIVAFDEHGRAYQPLWPSIDIIIGNPPFVGDRRMRGELGDRYVDALRELYSGQVPGGADLVVYWFERARNAITHQRCDRVGLIATNSIRYGLNRRILEQINKTCSIFMAWSDRPWVLEGASVRVSMIGFDRSEQVIKVLNGSIVTAIHADLTSEIDLTAAQVLLENGGLSFLGMMKAGPFDIEQSAAQRYLSAPTNINGRSNSDIVKRRLGGQDITGRSRNGWVIDFGVDTTLEDASLYELPFEYIRTVVKPIRDQSRRNAHRVRWWIYGDPRRRLRQAISSLERCIITPEVSKHRIFVWMDTNIIPDHSCHVIASDRDYIFGVLHSHVHEIWSLRVGNTLEDRPRYNSSKTFGTFPFPWAPRTEDYTDVRVQAIAHAASELAEKRDIWLTPSEMSEAELKKRTLTNLYNQRPTWLDLAHQKLDRAVFAAYGWEYPLSDEEILERLLALNLERAATQGNVAPVPADGEDPDDE